MKNLLLICGLISVLFLSGCPFKRKGWIDKNGVIAKGDYQCDTGVVKISFPLERRKGEYNTLDAAMTDLRSMGVSDKASLAVRQSIQNTCSDEVFTNSGGDIPSVPPIFSKINDAEPPSTLPRNVLGRYERKVKTKKVSFILYPVDAGDNSSQVLDFVANTFRDSPCNPFSNKCIACRRPNKYYRAYCSVPNF